MKSATTTMKTKGAWWLRADLKTICIVDMMRPLDYHEGVLKRQTQRFIKTVLPLVKLLPLEIPPRLGTTGAEFWKQFLMQHTVVTYLKTSFQVFLALSVTM